MRTIIALLCAVSCAAVLAGGCSTAGPGPDIPADPEFRDRTSPENVVYNMELAYEEMDLEEYLDCLSVDFEFFPNEDDVNDPDYPLPPVWWKADEAALHENMFSDESNVDNISLTLTVATVDSIGGIPEDPLDDIYIYIVDVDLRVNLDNGDGFIATAQSQFNMRIDIDQPNPIPDPDDVLWWEIYGWYDLGDEGRGVLAGRVEDSSWGTIKALYW